MVLMGHWSGCIQFFVPVIQGLPDDSWIVLSQIQVSQVRIEFVRLARVTVSQVQLEYCVKRDLNAVYFRTKTGGNSTADLCLKPCPICYVSGTASTHPII